MTHNDGPSPSNGRAASWVQSSSEAPAGSSPSQEEPAPASTPRGRLEHLAQAPIPTRWGVFQTHVFRWNSEETEHGLSNEHVALVMGEVQGAWGVPVRVHSECLTSEVFGSMKCDCKQQLEWAQAELAARGKGVILYLRQEGRGIGLANKIRAYALQAEGADTVEANELLHLPVDARQYDMAAEMLRALGVQSIQLMTNNPEKVEQLVRLGVRVEQRLPAIVDANPFSAPYLEVKRRRLRHDLPSGMFGVVQGVEEPGNGGTRTH
ncbi:MAG: GTP cyclohydrolase II [Polyangiaceae bacterium]|nr:GTP cyclohydrolase II [Polyangiaceae bacterium]